MRQPVVLVFVAASLQGAPTAAQIAPIANAPAALSAPRALRLEVLINGMTTNMVVPFVLTPPDQLSATRGDLDSLGIKLPGRGGPKDVLALDDLPSVRYRYDEPKQQVDIRLSDVQRRPRIYDARGDKRSTPAARADWGAVVNYTLYGASTGALPSWPHFAGANATLDARLFGPPGAFTQTGIVGRTLATDQDALRLDSAYVYSDPASLTTARAGDTISGGLPWTRPIRLGGLQWQSDFTLRGDLVTQPTPIVSGSAAVPSTVDVFVNDVKALTENVGAGPYQIVNLPTLSGADAARVVVTDASGRQTQTTMPIYVSPNMLAAGLTDFSVEGGFARRNYASASDDYDPSPIGSATLRRGLYDELTVEAHGEGGDGLLNAGVGAVARLGGWGIVSAAASGSRAGNGDGLQLYGAYAAKFGDISFAVSSQRAFGGYADLAAVTAGRPLYGATPGLYGYGLSAALTGWDPRPPRAMDQASLGAPLPFAKIAASLSFINIVAADATRSRVLAATAAKQLPWNASLYATVFLDFSNRRSAGVFAGISIPMGADTNVSANVSSGPGGDVASVEAQKTLQNADGSYGWRVQDSEGATPYREVDASYRSGYGTAAVGVQQLDRTAGASAQIDGSIAAMDGGVLLGEHIQDSFAVVDAGAPGVPVFQDNRPIGVTDSWGRLLVPDLHGYQANRIGIDPTGLPADAEADVTQANVVPARRSGVAVDFGVKTNVRGAIVTLVGADGKFLPAGSKGTLAGTQETFVVGYDGQAYIRGLAGQNAIAVDLGDRDCQASFAYAPAVGKRVAVGPVPCR